MNINLIEKIINTNVPCPNFAFQNPLLDKNVSSALAKSFVKILNISDQNSNANNNLRMSVLENIRKVCTVEPEGHVKADDNFTEMLTEFYNLNIKEYSTISQKAVDKKLDAFLVRKLKNLDINSSHESSLNPEILQALINLSENGLHLDILSKDVIFWNIRTTAHMLLLKALWDDPSSESDDVSIKMKPEIEKLLLHVCLDLFTTRNQDLENIFSKNSDLMDLVKKCTNSPNCFQISSGILNFLFILTNFDSELQRFIPHFVKLINESCLMGASLLYPKLLNPIALFLDFNIDALPGQLRDIYVKKGVSYLQNVHKESENDLILLLSHFPQWFDVYFSYTKADGQTTGQLDRRHFM